MGVDKYLETSFDVFILSDMIGPAGMAISICFWDGYGLMAIPGTWVPKSTMLTSGF